MKIEHSISSEINPTKSPSAKLVKLDTRPRSRLVLPTSTGYEVIKINNIIHLQAEGNYSTVFLSDGRKFLCSKTLKVLSGLLEGNSFIRIHQSHLINLNFVVRINRVESDSIELAGNIFLPLARSRKKEVLDAIMQM